MMQPDAETIWVLTGFLGQGLFFVRLLLQWIESERTGRSTIPVGFWVASLFGGVLLFFYAIHRRDPVFMAGQSTGVIVYARNLQLIARERRPATDMRADER